MLFPRKLLWLGHTKVPAVNNDTTITIIVNGSAVAQNTHCDFSILRTPFVFIPSTLATVENGGGCGCDTWEEEGWENDMGGMYIMMSRIVDWSLVRTCFGTLLI